MNEADLYTEDLHCKICLSLIIVTRGDVDLTEVKRASEWVCLTEIVVWDNSQQRDLSVFGRYAAIDDTTENVVAVVDDDVALDSGITKLAAAYEPGHVVCNMPERFRDVYTDSALVGFGAIFDRDLPEQAFDRFFADDAHKLTDAEFFRTADVIFTTLTPRVLVDVPYREMPWAHADNRMWKQPGHVAERTRVLELARQVRDGVTA